MKRLLLLGISLIVGVELLVLTASDRRFVMLASGVAVALVLIDVRAALGRGAPREIASDPDEFDDALRRWLSTTETTIRFSDSTRVDWDRHLRPALARRFEIATGQRMAKDPAAFHATGRMLFGTDLWEWVNPNNVAKTGNSDPGPGRAALEAILQRMEQI